MLENNRSDNSFDQFFEHKESLTMQFANGDITKKEFIEEHYNYILKMKLEPFKNGIDSFEKGIYNYQYYNMLAKYCYMKSKDRKLRSKHPYVARKYEEKANHNYNQKDWSTLKLLEYLEFENMDAYFIKVNSRALKNKVFEIVLKDYDSIILHSKSEMLLERLREEGIFDERAKVSVIDHYINQKYL